MGSGELGPEMKRSRRALSVIDQNLVGARGYPSFVDKSDLTQNTNSLLFFFFSVNEAALMNFTHPIPFFRRFAAQIANTQKQQETCPQDNKKLDPVIQNSSNDEDCKLIDGEEEHKAALDLPATISLQQADAAPNHSNQTEEVEIEDIFEEPILDIDGCDAKNPLAVVDYLEDLYSHYRKMETSSCVSPDYMAQQFDINKKKRAILIDWLIEEHYKLGLRDETLFLTVNLIDRFVERQSVVGKKLQLVGLIAMLLARKYEEVSVPVVKDLIFISDGAYTRKDLLDMLELLSSFLIELALVEYEMLKYPPSLLAAAAVYTARCTAYGFKQWNKTCEWYTKLLTSQKISCCEECSRHLVEFHQNAATGKLTGVHRKYSTLKFGGEEGEFDERWNNSAIVIAVVVRLGAFGC
ncbi:hypothetical protein Ancab_026678 [Ancistrocladus abbreviatus]